ncbi:MAG: calcium/sodium antiporter [Elusimicrobia bacterium]|jgi:cation:H+ antiporter|nr:calcium/sodium antiporter [Elusimicrobiota bacterium]
MNITNIILFLTGVGIIWFSADRFIYGGIIVARGLGVSNLIVGLTIGALGTSMPELLVSWLAAGMGNTSLAIGNVVGSNIANIGLALGLGAIIYPVKVEKDVLKFGYWALLMAALLFFVFTLNLTFSRPEGIFFLVLFAGYIFLMVIGHRRTKYIPKKLPAGKSLVSGFTWFILSSAGLFIGARLMVTKGILIAEYMGVSEAVIAIAVIAIGTSLPEIAVVVAGSIKKTSQISIGTIVGSNIINILLIAGGSVDISPSPVIINSAENIFMAPAVLAFSLVLLPVLVIRRRIGRFKGAFLVIVYIAYIAVVI